MVTRVPAGTRFRARRRLMNKLPAETVFRNRQCRRAAHVHCGMHDIEQNGAGRARQATIEEKKASAAPSGNRRPSH